MIQLKMIWREVKEKIIENGLNGKNLYQNKGVQIKIQKINLIYIIY
jgi:hypothetical protein